MKNLKMLYIALIALVAGTFGACTTDAYEAGPQVAGPQVSFAPTNPKSIEFTGADGEGTQKLTLTRAENESEAELSVFVIAEIEKGAETLFSIPELVTFAAGETTAELVMNIQSTQLENGKAYTVKLYLDESMTTPYGYAEWQIVFTVNPWELMTDSKGNDVKGKFRGLGFIDALDVDTSIEVDVDIYKHKSLDGIYKIANPWQMSLAIDLGFSSLKEAEAAGLVALNDLIIDASNPSAVIVAEQEIGIDIGMGPMFVFTGYPDYLDAAVGAGTLVDGVITFPKKGTYAYFPEYNAESIYYGNNSGMIRIVLPGVEIANYSLAVAYDGMDVAADNKTTTAKFKFTYGDDVTGIKYMIVKGNVESNPTEALTTLFAGQDENILAVENFVKGSKEAGVRVGMESGIYTMVAAPADKNGALRSKEAIVYSFYFKGIGEAEEHPCELTIGTDKFSVRYPNYASQYPDYSAFAFGIYGKDIKSAKYFVNSTDKINQILADEGKTMEMLVLEAGRDIDVTQVNSETGFVSNAIGLEADTEYSVIVWAENNYGETALVVATHTTDKAPEYTGELAIGDYKMSCVAKVQTGETTFEDMPFESVFTLSPNGESETEFFVTNLGMEDGKKWYATYDATAGTLTLDGTIVGLESKGSVISKVIYGQAGQYYYTVFNYASEESKGSDPIVFGVDPTTKQISSLNSIELEVAAFDGSLNYLGFLALYQGATTTIVPYTEQPAGDENGGASTASVKSVRVPFSRVAIDKSIVASKSNKLQSIEAAGIISNTKKLGVRTVKPTFVENYTPEKVKGSSIVKANAVAFRR